MTVIDYEARRLEPAYHPEDPEYVVRWHQYRQDIPDDPENLYGSWKNIYGDPVDPLDFPPPE